MEANADRPDRATNSGDYDYQPTEPALEVVRFFGSPGWESVVKQFHVKWSALRELWAAERVKQRIPLILPDSTEVALSPGGHSELIAAIVEEFAPCFTPGARVVYLGDTGTKWIINDVSHFDALGLELDSHGKMPDVVIHYFERNWLVLVEAVTSHGPMDAKRVGELKDLFAGALAGLVFVTALPDSKTFRRYASEIAWETEVWIRSAPSHLIHFNGERFLGPYE